MRKIGRLCMAGLFVVFLLVFTCVPFMSANAALRGDVNLDGILTTTDLDQLKEHVVGIRVLTGQALKNADLNNDGEISSTDVVQLKQILEGVLLFTVTFSPNGGSVSPTSREIAYGSTYATLPTPTRTGHVFAGWYTATSGGTRIYDTTTFNLTSNQTLYARWTPRKYTVSFNANGGSVSPTSREIAYGSTYATLPTPTRTGYSFAGWYTATSGGTRIYDTTTFSLTSNQTLYARWTKIYTVAYNANGGVGTPSSQTKKQNISLTLSSYVPTKSYVVRYNSNGGSVSPASKNVSCTFNSWNTSANGSGTTYASGSTYTGNADITLYAQWKNPAAGSLATPSRTGYIFTGWYTSASGGTRITNTSIITGNLTIYAHWVDIYNMGDETYSFENYSDSISEGHCFGMAMTSAGYHIGALDIGLIGGNANTPLYSFGMTTSVMRNICNYQRKFGYEVFGAIVAGDSFDRLKQLDYSTNDWQYVVDYVRNHEYDNTGMLTIIIWDLRGKILGHAVNFLRYENVDGQDRLYAYDNNFPNRETYFYQDASGNVKQAPIATLSGTIDSIGLWNCETFFKLAPKFNITRAIYMQKDSASIEGYTYSYMPVASPEGEFVVYEIPASEDRVIIVPQKDNADFIYMDTEYSFGTITEETRGELTFASMIPGAADEHAQFRIFEAPPPFGKPDFTLPSSLTTIDESAFEGISARAVYIPNACTSIGAYAFRNAAIEKIRIPARCSIAATAFDGCGAICIYGTTGSPAEVFCNTHENFTFIAE